VVVGPGGDEGLPLTVDLTRTGGLLVVGPPASGRSTLLAALALELIRHGVSVLGVGREPPAGLGDHHDALTWARPWDVGIAADWLAGPPGTTGVVIADDVGAAADWPVLTQLGHGISGRPPIVVAAGTAADLTGHYQGTLATLRRNRSGLLLCPGPAEADVLGLRLPRTPVPVRPGSGWLAVGGRLERVQVARRRPAAPACGEHRRAGPVPVGAVR
jgi:S-DNA-T family DNA segregation ATPase FtsK/SpoIIIE